MEKIKINNNEEIKFSKINRTEQIKDMIEKELKTTVKYISFNFTVESDFFEESMLNRILEVYTIKLNEPEKFNIITREKLIKAQKKLPSKVVIQIIQSREDYEKK